MLTSIVISIVSVLAVLAGIAFGMHVYETRSFRRERLNRLAKRHADSLRVLLEQESGLVSQLDTIREEMSETNYFVDLVSLQVQKCRARIARKRLGTTGFSPHTNSLHAAMQNELERKVLECDEERIELQENRLSQQQVEKELKQVRNEIQEAYVQHEIARQNVV